MWHELVLHGIGGRTVAEAKLSMTYDEFLAWNQYVRTRGTLNEGLRLEWLFARLSLQVNRAVGGKGEFQDLIRYHEEPAADLDDVAKLMGVRQVKNNA